MYNNGTSLLTYLNVNGNTLKQMAYWHMYENKGDLQY